MAYLLTKCAFNVTLIIGVKGFFVHTDYGTILGSPQFIVVTPELATPYDGLRGNAFKWLLQRTKFSLVFKNNNYYFFPFSILFR